MSRTVLSERLELRLPLDASGFSGNACAPDLDLSAIEIQTVRIGEAMEFNLFDAGATVVDLDADGNPTGDSIRLQLDPDDNPVGATLTSDGLFRWTPAGDQVGSFEIMVIAVDNGDPPLADAEVFLVEVRGNENPDLSEIDDATATIGATLEVRLTASDSDGNNLTFQLDPDLSVPGLVVEQSDGETATLRFTPSADQAGQSIPVTVLVVDDGFPPLSDKEEFTIEVGSVGAAEDSFNTGVDQVLVVDAASGVLTNDFNSEGAALTAELVEGPSNGTLDFSADGAFTYTPDGGFQGEDTFTYRAMGSNGDSSSGVVRILTNTSPTTNSDSYVIDEDQTLTTDAANGLLANDVDPDGDTLSAMLFQSPESGILTLNADGTFVYEPEFQFSGEVSFTYQVTDGFVSSDETSVVIAINPVNDGPIAVGDTYETNEDETLVVPLERGVTVNDIDADGDVLTVELVDGPVNGTLQLNSNGAFTYTPDGDFNGQDSFLYTARDGALPSTTNVIVNVVSVNDAPVALDDAFTTSESETLMVDAAAGLLSNDTDVDDDLLMVELVAGVGDGVLNLDPDGAFSYLPNPNFNGSDTFSYRTSDGVLTSDIATVVITVDEVNVAPVAVLDDYVATEDETLIVDAASGVLANDTDADGDNLTAILLSEPAQGTFAFNEDGSFEYTPDQNATGLDGFTYQASDGEFVSGVVLVSITTTTTNDAPVAASDSYEVLAGNVLVVDADSGLLANDSDVEGDALSVALSEQAANGDVLLMADGSFTYTPNGTFFGSDTFEYEVSDGTDSAFGTVSIEVTPTNAFTISQGAAEGTVVGTVGPEGEFTAPLIYQRAPQGRQTELLLNADDHLSGDPAAPVVLIEYLDFQCPVCARFHPIVNDLEEDFVGDLLVVRRHFPLESIHPNARVAARAAEAAGRQGQFEAMGDLLFENQTEWSDESDPTSLFESYAQDLGLDLDQYRTDVADAALDARITRDFDAALELNASGTPTFFLNNTLIANPSDAEEFAGTIEDALRAVDETFAINRETGQILVADSNGLVGINSTTVPVLVTDINDQTETIDVQITVREPAQAEAEATSFAAAVDALLAR